MGPAETATIIGSFWGRGQLRAHCDWDPQIEALESCCYTAATTGGPATAMPPPHRFDLRTQCIKHRGTVEMKSARKLGCLLPLLATLTAAVSLALACDSSPQPTPNVEGTVQAQVQATVEAQTTRTPAPADTPVDIEAEVRARVQATVEAQQSARPVPTETPRDIEAEVQERVQATVEAQLTPSPAPPSGKQETTPVAPAELQPAVSVSSPEFRLAEMLPRDVFEQFEDDFYGGCSEPPFDRLRISASWSAEGERDIEFRPPRGSYFLVLRANPSGKAWRFDSVLESARGRRHQSLHVDSTAPDELTDAQQWCSTGSGITVPDVLHVDSQNIAWTVYLVTPDGTDPLPREVLDWLLRRLPRGASDCRPRGDAAGHWRLRALLCLTRRFPEHRVDCLPGDARWHGPQAAQRRLTALHPTPTPSAVLSASAVRCKMCASRPEA